MDDSQYLARALEEYREASRDDADFADLPDEVQHVIVHRAQQLRAACEEENVFAA